MPPNRDEEKVEAAAARQAVMDRYSGRCAGHDMKHPAATVHEIIPRSKRPRSYWKDPMNMIPLCAELHEQVHREGALNWRERLDTARRQTEVLLTLGY